MGIDNKEIGRGFFALTVPLLIPMAIFDYFTEPYDFAANLKGANLTKANLRGTIYLFKDELTRSGAINIDSCTLIKNRILRVAKTIL